MDERYISAKLNCKIHELEIEINNCRDVLQIVNDKIKYTYRSFESVTTNKYVVDYYEEYLNLELKRKTYQLQ